MDSSTRLDHALFQLTPTRTRCDLVIFAGGVSERLASGLLEPFLAHLKSAKDQISKGGYSISLRPSGVHASWFTKATLQRFVRFVSTPEVLERLVTIEKEIVQIESSIQSTENSSVVTEAEGHVSFADWNSRRSTTVSKLRDELNGTNHAGSEENSRVCLQRVLDNRKAVLRKEQAMAYARALVAGFDLNSVDDLIYFADAFGASRLREACINFVDLCKQKNEDRLWIDEIAAMQACSQPDLPYLRTSGIILADEDNDPNGKQNGLLDASFSESTASHASLDINQDNSLPTSARTPSTDGKAQIPMPWPNNLPQYHNFQGPVFQQMPPYQGYLYPGMQIPSSYFPGNMQWPPNVEDSRVVLDREMDDHWNRKESFKNKKKHSQVLENSEEGSSTASNNSSYESDSDERSKYGKKHSTTEQLHKKKHGKKSSRKVVIRNINYITSNENGKKGSISEGSLSNEEEFINGDSLKQQVEEAVESLERRHKSTSRHHKKHDKTKLPGNLNNSNGIKGNDNWDAFQNLLLREEEPTFGAEKQPVQFEEEYVGNQNIEYERSSAFNLKSDKVNKTQDVSNDAFIVTDRKLDHEYQTCIEYYKEGKDVSPIIKKMNSTNEELLFPRKNEESGNYSSAAVPSGRDTESSITKCHKEEDWFMVGQSDKPANEDGNRDFSMFNGVSISSSATGGFHAEKNKKDLLVDDSFMIQARSSENQFNSQSAAHISLDSDIVGSTEIANSGQETLRNKNETLNAHEPDDLFMVLERESAVEQNVAPWTVEMDYENNFSTNDANSKPLNVDTDENQSNCEGTSTKTSGVRTGRVSNKEAKSKALNGSLGKSKSDIMSRSKASPGSRTTVMKSKYDKEEEKRKRMEELMIQRQRRIAERGSSKKTGTEKKTSLTSVKNEKPKIPPSTKETKKVPKPVLRNSTIDRLAIARVSQKVSPIQAKSGPTKKPALKANGVPSQKTAGAEKKKLGPKEVKPLIKKDHKGNINGVLSLDTDTQTQHDVKSTVVLPKKHGAAQSVEPTDINVGLKDIKELRRTSSAEKNAGRLILEREAMLENVGQLDVDSSVPNQNGAFGGNLSRGEVLDKVSSVPGEDKTEHITDVIVNPTAASPNKALTVSFVNSKVNYEIHENYPVSPKTSGIEISTPPPSNRVTPEPIHSRKKWNSDEDSSKAAKGFRKLLFFGRKS